MQVQDLFLRILCGTTVDSLEDCFLKRLQSATCSSPERPTGWRTSPHSLQCFWENRILGEVEIEEDFVGRS